MSVANQSCELPSPEEGPLVDVSLYGRSPCVGTCRLDASKQLCLGCSRTVREIATWRDLTLNQRQSVNAACALRSGMREPNSGMRSTDY